MHCTWTRCLYLKEVPVPVIYFSYAASVRVPAACNQWQTISTVFPKLVFRPTLSNIPNRVLNSPCIHPGSDDAIMMSSA